MTLSDRSGRSGAWTAPHFVEINMSAEIGGYQADDDGERLPPDIAARPAAPSARRSLAARPAKSKRVLELGVAGAVLFFSARGSAMSPGLTSYWDAPHATENIFYLDVSGEINRLTHTAAQGWRASVVFPGAETQNNYASLISYFDGGAGHLIWADPNGNLQELVVGATQATNMTKKAGALAATPNATLTAYWDGSNAHVFYQSSTFDMTIHEMVGNNGSWFDRSLGAKPLYSTGDPVAVFGMGITSSWDGSVGHVYYDTPNSMQELYYYGTQWWPGFSASGTGAPFGMLTSASIYAGYQYVSGSSTAYGAHWQNTSQTVNWCQVGPGFAWSCNVDSVGANEYGQLQPGVTFAFGGGLQTFVVGNDGVIYTSGEQLPRSTPAMFSDFAPWWSPISGFYDGSYKHVFYIGNDAHIHEYYAQIRWATNDLMVGTGALLSAH